MEKITMQDIADALGISRVTVSKAFNNQSGVSESLRDTIFQKARELGYAKVPYTALQKLEQTQASAQQHTSPANTVSLIVSRPDSAVFWTSIIHRMAQELACYNINLMYTYVPSAYTPDFSLPPILKAKNSMIAGCVILNVYDSTILSMVNELSVPKVFLDTVPSLYRQQLNGDLLLIEGYRTEYDITESLVQSGHTRIGFLGDIYYAQTNLERYRGYCACMQAHRLEIDAKYCLTGSIGIFSYGKELQDFLSSLDDWPTAFVCVSDFMAHFVKQYMDENPQYVPYPVELTGFDNSDEYTNVAGTITTANVPTSLLGKRLALQLLFRTQHPDAPYELTFVRPTIVPVFPYRKFPDIRKKEIPKNR
ncbi:MAG: LacI family DNA-binding transcriptional regulator [Eubacterium sp.]|nr:LacI family DNA-binding transcriptional regulator [Eubacterium sp.]